MSLSFALPLGNATLAAAAATPQIGTAQQDAYLERLSVSCLALGVAASGIVTRATVASQSITASPQSFPVEMLAPNAQCERSNVLGVALASGSSVEVIVTPDAPSDISGMVGTAPVPAGVSPSGFTLDALTMIFGMGDAGVIAPGAAFALTSVCNRAATLDQIFGSTDLDNVYVNSIMIAGEEQINGAGEIEINSQLGFLATDQDGHSLAKSIVPGESITISGLNRNAAPTTFVRFGIFCI
jgi:hypothetical protein